jgi:hypothetical protein
MKPPQNLLSVMIVFWDVYLEMLKLAQTFRNRSLYKQMRNALVCSAVESTLGTVQCTVCRCVVHCSTVYSEPFCTLHRVVQCTMLYSARYCTLRESIVQCTMLYRAPFCTVGNVVQSAVL